MKELDDWAGAVDGLYIDVDGYAGNQCWDASQSWLWVIAPGCTLWTRPSSTPGLAAGCWDVVNSDTPEGADLRRHVTPVPGDQPGQAGDVIIWKHGARLYPDSHTAVLLADLGALLDCMSQNSSPGRPWQAGYSPQSSGPVIRQQLAREGIAGFLRPNTLMSLSGTITPLGDPLMALSDDEQRRLLAAADRINGTIPDRRTPTGAPQTVLLTDDGGYITAQLAGIAAQIGATLTKADGGYIVGLLDALRPGATDPDGVADAVIAAVGHDLAAQVVAAIGQRLGATA